MASSSLLCQFLLISVVAIGTFLMIVPNVQALECYHYATKNASSGMGGRAAWKLNPKFRTAIGGIEENSFAPLSIGDGHPTRQCPDYSTFCATLHCANLFGKLGFFKNKLVWKLELRTKRVN
jgi:hypothetical protein